MITAFPFKKIFRLSFFLTIFLATHTGLWAEGTKQVAPNSTDITMLLTNAATYGNFAAYNSVVDSRLNIHIANPATEQVYFGFSQMTSTADASMVTTTYYFRVKNASGAVVFGPQMVNNTNANANTWAKANAGPAPIVGASGYTPFTYIPAAGAAAGDYYIEFSTSSAFDSNTEVDLPFWDITVATQTAPTAINGRLWSKKWALRTETISGGSDPTYGAFDRPFNGQVFTYSDDGFVNKIDFNNSGFRGLRFNLSFNQTGTANTGNVVTDRKSAANVNSTNPQYRLFLNNPDLAAYPSGTIGSIATLPFILDCPSSTVKCVAYSTTLPGLVQILLDFNSASGAGVYDPGTADVLLYETVTPGVGEVAPYKRCVTWDGKNGLGATVSTTVAIPVYLTYFQGVVHFPMYDVEYNVNGFNVSPVRPTPNIGYVIKMKYDDAAIAAASGSGEPISNTFTGATQPAHRWTNFNFGNVNTINTYWAGSESTASSANVPFTPSCTFTGPMAVCASSTGNTHTGPASQDTYAWTISGSGTIVGSASGQTVSVTAGASGSYILTLTTTKSTCSQTCSQTISVGLTTAITGTTTTCFNTMGLTFSGTAGMNSYAWTITGNGTISGVANAQNVTVNAGAAGSFTLNLTVTGNGGACTAMASQTVTVTASCAENKYLYLTDPSQGLDRIDPVATVDGTTATSATLSAAAAGIVVDATSTTTAITGPITVSHTTGTGSNRLMLVGISQKNKLVTSVTYGGVALTLVGENIAGGNARVHIYRLLNPPSGTANVVVNFSANPDKGAIVGVTTFSGVDQTTPLGTFVSAQGNASDPSVTATSAVGELVFDVVSKRNQTLTVGAGQTQRWNIASASEITGASSTETGSASVVMSWTASSSDQAIAAIPIKPATFINNTSFTQGTPMCSPLSIPASSVITVTNYVNIVSGTMPASPNITAVLKYGATTILTLTNPTYNSTTGLLTWTGTLGSTVTVPAGQAIALTVTTAETGAAFNILYDSQAKPSKITIPTSTFISVSNISVYSATYPGGSVITNIPQTGSSYVRVTVTDPFGAYDINKVNLTLTNPSGGTTTATLSNPQIVGTTTCGNIYQYKWTNPATLGNWTIQAVAFEGTEGVTANASLPVTVVPQIGPVQASKQLYLSDPSQALDRIDPVATADATTAQTAALLVGGSETVAIDATSTTVSLASPITLSHTTGTGSNRLMLVGISQKNKVVSSVTYGGTALTLVGEEIGNGNAKIHIYELVNPPSGAANVVVNFSAAPDKGAVVAVTTFTGVNQTTPLGTFVSAQANSTNPTVSVTSASGELVFDVVTIRNQTLTVGSGQTQRWNLDSGSETTGGGGVPNRVRQPQP